MTAAAAFRQASARRFRRPMVRFCWVRSPSSTPRTTINGMARRIVECVMNVSEGRRRTVLGDIGAVIESTPHTFLLDVSADPDHNRTVFTFISTPQKIEEAAMKAIGKTVEAIDLRRHSGVHPRIGAADVVPFVPIEGVTIQECVELAHRLGNRVADELHVPVFFYEYAALRPERKNLAEIRRGGLEGLRRAIGEDPSRRPDVGPSRLHPTAGAAAIGVRDPLIAFNVYLETENVGAARRIARLIRERDGGLPAVKALGLFIKRRGQAQVSMNLTDFRRTSPAVAFQRILEEADRCGVRVACSELIGLAPRAALPEGSEKALRIENFDARMILENRIEEALRTASEPLPW